MTTASDNTKTAGGQAVDCSDVPSSGDLSIDGKWVTELPFPSDPAPDEIHVAIDGHDFTYQLVEKRAVVREEGGPREVGQSPNSFLYLSHLTIFKKHRAG